MPDDVRTAIAAQLARSPDRPLLRIATSPGAREVVEYSGASLVAAARRLVDAQRLTSSTQPILLLLPHSPELFLLQIGLTLDGHVPAVLPWPTTRVDPDKYRRNLRFQLANLPIDHLITLPGVAEAMRSSVRQQVSTCDVDGGRFDHDLERLPPLAEPAPAAPPAAALPSGVMFLQFSGGTTGTQKCIAITETMLSAQLTRLTEALGVRDSDSIVSWLPLYHDMGLVASLWMPLFAQIPSTHIAAADWIMRPAALFEYAERFRSTLCWLPNFAFSYLARQRPRMERSYALEHVRAWINCSEPVRRESTGAFLDAFGGWGVRGASLHASYAMAENVFAITQTSLGSQPRASGPIGSSGVCLPGMRVRVVGADGTPCGISERGAIEISSPSLFDGYWSSTGMLRSTFTEDGWHSTGDIGFLDRGELFVTGRLTDLIIVGGQNVFPEDVEALAGEASGVHPGRVAAFAVDDSALGTQSIAVVAELTEDLPAWKAAIVEAEIRARITAGIGIAPRHVVAVPRQWIVKSTAGKISRQDTRVRFLRDFET